MQTVPGKAGNALTGTLLSDSPPGKGYRRVETVNLLLLLAFTITVIVIIASTMTVTIYIGFTQKILHFAGRNVVAGEEGQHAASKPTYTQPTHQTEQKTHVPTSYCPTLVTAWQLFGFQVEVSDFDARKRSSIHAGVGTHRDYCQCMTAQQQIQLETIPEGRPSGQANETNATLSPKPLNPKPPKGSCSKAKPAPSNFSSSSGPVEA